MSSYSSAIVLNVLWKEFPDVANRITDKIKSAMPEIVLSDPNEIKTIVEDYCELKELSLETWCNQPGQTRITDDRELLLAVVIMFFQPERLNGMCEKQIKRGIVKELSIVMKCSKRVISESILASINNYKIYSDFKFEVHNTYDQLISNHYGKG